MEERKQELVIKISNQTIEFHLENGPAENFHTFCHVDDNGIIICNINIFKNGLTNIRILRRYQRNRNISV